MQLKSGNTVKCGIPYMGSKSKIIDQIARFFPNAENFYDLFGGGFSVTHYMLLTRKKSYKYFYYNELRTGVCELIQDAINGKYNYDVFKPKWISREEFFDKKEIDSYIKIIWSFGNNGRNYIFGEEIENQKRSMHQAVVFDEFDEYFINTFKINKWPFSLDIIGKRLYLKKIIRELKYETNDCQRLQQLEQLERLEQLQQLLQLERLQRLQQLERLQQLQLTNLSYDEVKIKENSVIYCDIPYYGTSKYSNIFDHKKFFDWAANQNNPLFISEYDVSDERFFLIKKIIHRSTLSAINNNEVTEKLYCNKIAYDIIQKYKEKK
jgi:site-specific DNA-adenine methylase